MHEKIVSQRLVVFVSTDSSLFGSDLAYEHITISVCAPFIVPVCL